MQLERYPFSKYTKSQPRTVSKKNAPNAKQLSRSSAEGDVRSSKVVYRRLRQHGVVLNLGLAQRRAVASDEDQLGYNKGRGTKKKVSHRGPSQHAAPVPDAGIKEWTITFAVAHLLEGRFVPEVVLARLDDEGEACRD